MITYTMTNTAVSGGGADSYHAFHDGQAYRVPDSVNSKLIEDLHS